MQKAKANENKLNPAVNAGHSQITIKCKPVEDSQSYRILRHTNKGHN